MKTVQIAQWITGIALGGVLLGSAIQPALAGQQDPSTKIIPSLVAQHADVQELIAKLFQQAGVSYTIAPNVQGTLTVSLKDVTFEQVLQNVLRQVGATYRVERGIYEIVKRDEPVTAPTTAEEGGTAVTAVQDGEFLFVVRGTTIYKVRKSNLDVTSTKQL